MGIRRRRIFWTECYPAELSRVALRFSCVTMTVCELFQTFQGIPCAQLQPLQQTCSEFSFDLRIGFDLRFGFDHAGVGPKRRTK